MPVHALYALMLSAAFDFADCHAAAASSRCCPPPYAMRYATAAARAPSPAEHPPPCTIRRHSRYAEASRPFCCAAPPCRRACRRFAPAAIAGFRHARRRFRRFPAAAYRRPMPRGRHAAAFDDRLPTPSDTRRHLRCRVSRAMPMFARYGYYPPRRAIDAARFIADVLQTLIRPFRHDTPMPPETLLRAMPPLFSSADAIARDAPRERCAADQPPQPARRTRHSAERRFQRRHAAA